MCQCQCGGERPKALYSVPELAKLSGQSRFAIGRLLERNNVHLERNGTRRVVPLAALRSALPWIFDSIAEARGLRT